MRRLAWVLAALAALAWVPFIARPLSPDEGGFLLVASQWQPGRSLYGHYWVDRPPLLLTLFDLATHLGGAIGLRLMGVVVVVGSVLLAALLTRLAAGRRTLTPVLVAAVFLSTPLFGTTEVNGELLAVPLVLAGLVALVRAWQGAFGWSVAAGAAAMAAMLVKQNVVDVFVVAAVLVALAVRRSGARRGLALAGGIGSGALGVLAATLVLAEARGTEPGRLWDAVVAFRAQASAVIGASSTSATSDRFVSLLVAAALSGAPLLVVVLLLRLRGTASPDVSPDGPPDLRLPAIALLLWELVAVGAGGSYWLHYLIGLVPGMVLLGVAAAQRGARLWRATAAALALTVASCVVAVVASATSPTPVTDDARVAAYLRAHSTPHDSVVVGFGHPDIVWDAGLHSPYEQLWSLPVRVRDSSLTELTHVLRGPRAPTWVVVSGDSLATWGVDATTADHVLRRDYRPATTIGTYVVWRQVPRGQVPGRLADLASAT
jgi:hypothetical protein